MQPRYTFDETRDWVGELSRGVGAVVPDLVSWEWGKADRGGRARLDYTQNAIDQDARGAVRRAAGAWRRRLRADHLGRAGRPRPCVRTSWDIRSIVERVEAYGDLFSGVLADPQALPPLS